MNRARRNAGYCARPVAGDVSGLGGLVIRVASLYLHVSLAIPPQLSDRASVRLTYPCDNRLPYPLRLPLSSASASQALPESSRAPDNGLSQHVGVRKVGKGGRVFVSCSCAFLEELSRGRLERRLAPSDVARLRHQITTYLLSLQPLVLSLFYHVSTFATTNTMTQA